jgi:hypothetical protein
MRLAKLNEPDLLYVADNMREWDRREVFATRWDDDPAALTSAILAGGEFGWVAGNDLPVAAFGAIPTWQGNWQVWMFATDDWKDVAFDVTRFIRRIMIPSLEQCGCHRAECRSMEGHEEAHRWLETLGAYKESDLPHYGRNGEMFYLYRWTRPITQPHSQQPKE